MDTSPNPDDDGLTAVEKICIVMSPEFAQHMADRLQEQMKEYVSRFGALREVSSA
jgi:hypothetical protein